MKFVLFCFTRTTSKKSIFFGMNFSRCHELIFPSKNWIYRKSWIVSEAIYLVAVATNHLNWFLFAQIYVSFWFFIFSISFAKYNSHVKSYTHKKYYIHLLHHFFFMCFLLIIDCVALLIFQIHWYERRRFVAKQPYHLRWIYIHSMGWFNENKTCWMCV